MRVVQSHLSAHFTIHDMCKSQLTTLASLCLALDSVIVVESRHALTVELCEIT